MIHYIFAMPREAETFQSVVENIVMINEYLYSREEYGYSPGEKNIPRRNKIIPDGNIDIIGIGAEDLDPSKYTEEDILVNIGYAGGYKIRVGSLIEPAYAMDIKTWKAAPIDRIFMIERRICLTSDRFVEKPLSDGPHLYDMELYKIAQLPHKKIHSIKIISDNLNEKDCEAFNDEASWEKVVSLLEMRLREKT